MAQNGFQFSYIMVYIHPPVYAQHYQPKINFEIFHFQLPKVWKPSLSMYTNYRLYSSFYSCPRYGNLPYPCALITDFRNPCCKVPDCTFNGQVGEITGTLTPAPHIGPTLVPQPGHTNPTPALSMYLVCKSLHQNLICLIIAHL